MVVSDTHGNENALLRAYETAGKVDLLIHLGDGEGDTGLLTDLYATPVIKVAGNCDFGSTAPRELMINIEGRQLLMTHGDRYYVKSGIERLVNHGASSGADIVLYGHTHNPLAENNGSMLVLNPGALCLHTNRRTFAVVTLQGNTVEYIYQEVE